RTPQDERPLISELTVSISPGMRVLVTGANHAAKMALFRATAGIWDTGEGWLVRPGAKHLKFIPERPYLPHGTLRELLVAPGEASPDDERMEKALSVFDLGPIVARAGGLDTEQDWNCFLSLAEQQLIAFARMFLGAPQFAFLDRPTTTLGVEHVDRLLQTLSEH